MIPLLLLVVVVGVICYYSMKWWVGHNNKLIMYAPLESVIVALAQDIPLGSRIKIRMLMVATRRAALSDWISPVNDFDRFTMSIPILEKLIADSDVHKDVVDLVNDYLARLKIELSINSHSREEYAFNGDKFLGRP